MVFDGRIEEVGKGWKMGKMKLQKVQFLHIFDILVTCIISADYCV